MGDFFTSLIALVCIMSYMGVIGNSLRQLQRRQVVMTRVMLPFTVQSTRLTGTAALIYAGAQLVSGIVVIAGAVMASTRGDLSLLLIAFIIGWLIGTGGARFARWLHSEEAEFVPGRGVVQEDIVRGETTVSRDEPQQAQFLSQGGPMDDEIEDAEFTDVNRPDDSPAP